MKNFKITTLLLAIFALQGCAQLGDVGAECSADADCQEGLECHMHDGEEDHGECEAHEEDDHEGEEHEGEEHEDEA